MKICTLTVFVLIFKLGNAQVDRGISTKGERVVHQLSEKKYSYKDHFDYAVRSNLYYLIVELIQDKPQAVIDEIEGRGNFSYRGFEEMPLYIKVENALQMLEKNELKGSIYKELKKSLKKHIKRQKKNPAS